MKFFSIQKRQSQTHSSNLALRLLALLIFLLPLGISTARAADYVFMQGNNYIIINNSGALTTTTVFDPATCLWSGTSGGAFTNNRNTLKYSQNSPSGSGTFYYTTTLNTTGTDVPLVISADGTIQFTANVSATYYSIGGWGTWYPRSNTWYIQYNGTNVVASTTSSSTNNIKAYEYTTLLATMDAPAITGTQTLFSEMNDNHQFSHGDAIYRPTYGEFSTGSATYYWYESALQTVAPSSTTSGFTYAWSLSSNMSGYATVDNTGKVTYNTLVPEPIVSAELICTATHTSGTTKTAKIPLTFTNDGVLAKPIINITPSGTTATVTITGEEGSTIYYTTDGSEPSETSSHGTSPVTLTNVANQTVIKAFAKKNGYSNSIVAVNQFITSGVSNGVVVLNDYEDHTWTYYAGVPTDVDGGNYNTNYIGKMYSPDPRNVKITYNGVNGITGSTITVKVSTLTGEDQTSFVYYKTLEEGTTEGQYPYQVISNPFSVRPSTGSGSSKVFYGFAGWKIVSGGEYINGYSNGQTLPLDANITFVNLPYPSINCTSAEIVFETTWTQAKVQRGGGNVSHSSFNGGTYETNFCVINANSNSLEPTYPVTITGVEPDGSTTYSNTITGMVRPSNTSAVKMEYVTWNPNGAIAFQDRNVTIGRGVTCSGTVRDVTASNGGADINQVLKIESGTYGSFTHYSDSPTSSSFVKQHVYLGCDYDRAKNDNTKLTFKDKFLGNRIDGGSGYAQEAYRTYSKSGSFMTDVSISNAAKDNSYYLSRYTTSAPGRSRYLEIEGGEWYANISGGQDNSGSTPNNKTAFTLRMKGGKVRGSIYGAAQQTNCIGDRVIVITGGQIGGWVAGAANGIQSGSGYLYGSTYVYFGGNAEIATKYQERTTHATTSIQNSIGGYVFASGCGYNSNSHAGEVTVSTNVVMADESIVEYGVYGGGAYGYSSGTANVYVTGGHVESLYDSKYSVFGGVYGGARQNDGGTVNMYMTGGQIDGVTNSGNHGGGLFGGSNASGTIDNSVKMVVTGGQVGTTFTTANIHGGGYGQNTVVSGNVDVTIGKAVGEKGPDVFGNVFGGAALGTVTGSSTVTVNAGTCTGAIYGGGLGEQGNNTRGVVSGDITVTVNGTDPKPAGRDYAIEAVFGGGSYAPANCVPDVTVYNCDNSIGEVYGGGNAAKVQGTNVTVYGCNKIGSVFGGCNKADVTEAGTSVAIYGGIIDNVFGGNNHNGSIIGPVQVAVDAVSADENDPCQMEIGNVYGGGNEASYTDVDDDGDYPIVRIYDGSILHDVFGGGLGETARVTGNPQVEMTGGQVGGTLYGGGSAAPVTGTPHVKMDVSIHKGSGEAKSENWWDVKGYVFGGGLGESAKVTGNTKVEVLGTSRVGKNVYGGGNGGAVTGNTDVTIGGDPE